MKSKTRYLVGVDEAGRGPLAGPVAVGVAVVPRNFNWKLLPGVGDSKKVAVTKREHVAQSARILKRQGVLNFHVVLVSHRVIDQIGISAAVRRGIDECFRKLVLDPRSTSVKLDGLLHAPDAFKDQETIIKGDAKEKIIGLASILAKVTRDAHMVRVARKYPEYDFDIHKGYGTVIHRTALHARGLSSIHRRTFCKKYL